MGRVIRTSDVRDVGRPRRRMSSRKRGRPLKSGLRELYPRIKARASSGWGRFRVSVLRMAVPTGGSVPARPPRRPLAVRHRHSRPPGGRLCFPGGRPPTRPHAERRRPSLRASALAIARWSAPAVLPRLSATGAPPPCRLPAVRQAVHCADGLQPHPLARQPPSSAANSTLNGRISGEYKEGITNTLNLLPNLCFPRALSCTLHLLLGKPLLRKSEIVLGVSFGTPNTISAAWLLYSFIPYFCLHCNGQQTMVPLVH